MLRRLRKNEIRTIPVPHFVGEGSLLEGRIALITGGAGGIGYAVAEKFVASGGKVILAGRSVDTLELAVARLGDSASALALDLRFPENFAAQLDDLSPFPDILVNSAGLLSTTPFGSISIEEYDSVMSTNVRGVLFLTQAVSKRWIADGIAGNVLNISSGSQYKPGWTSYQVSKNALESLTKGMASFLIDHDIVVNAIAPGPVATLMLGLDDQDISFSLNPTERAVTPHEVAQWCAWLVSDIGRYAVGSTFALTGGNGIFHWERQEKYYSNMSHKRHVHSASSVHSPPS